MDPSTALQSWDLGTVFAVAEVQTGAVNRVFRADTAIGPVYLRAYRAKDRDVVVREHALISQVVAAGLPAVAPIASANGETVIMAEDTPYALYPGAPGAQVSKPDLGLEHATAAGEMLGRLHTCLARVADGGFRKYRLRWPADAWIERLAGIARAVAARSDDPVGGLVLDRIQDQRAWLADPRCRHEYQNPPVREHDGQVCGPAPVEPHPPEPDPAAAEHVDCAV
jgi:homoserine kinase type II